MDGLLLRETVPWSALGHALSEVLGLPLGRVRELDDGEASPEDVLVQINEHEVGFRMDLSLYRVPAGCPVELELAAGLARRLGVDVLHSPLEELGCNPAVWVLLRPDGGRFLVREPDPGSEDGVVDLRPERLTPVR